MLNGFVLSLFLYFPEDKTEYIPAFFSFVIFMIGAVFTMRLIIRVSRKEAAKAKVLEEQIMNQETHQR